MPRNPRILAFFCLALLLAGLLLAACQPAAPTIAPEVPGIAVSILPESCPNVVVESGQSVTWTNEDNAEHIVRSTPAGQSGSFDSGLLTPGDSFTFTFLSAGQFNYVCSDDGAMTGTVTVQ